MIVSKKKILVYFSLSMFFISMIMNSIGVTAIFMFIDPSHQVLMSCKQGKIYLTFQHPEEENALVDKTKYNNISNIYINESEPDHEIELLENENVEINDVDLNIYDKTHMLFGEIIIAFTYNAKNMSFGIFDKPPKANSICLSLKTVILTI